MTLDSPGRFVCAAILVVAAYALFKFARVNQNLVTMNLSSRIDRTSLTWRTATAFLPEALRILGLTLLVLTIGQPYDRLAVTPVDVRGIAIELVMDRSGSMLQDDYRLNDERVPRLRAVVDAASQFVVARQTNSRPDAHDMIGLVVFAKEADAVCPLTLDHEQLIARMEQLTVARDFREDGTAIGDGLALGIAELESLRRSLPDNGQQQDLSRVVVLLTDGQNNSGNIPPAEAAGLAAHFGVRVYVIGLEPDASTSSVARQRLQRERQRLTRMAVQTGGRFFAVGDTEGLQHVYAEINQLEQRLVGTRPVLAKRYWAVDSFVLDGWRVPALVVVALIVFVTESVLRRTIYLGPEGRS
ncbi:VWA domain-containing protein [Roseiconus nitratireducens]|nr:VWA domain-containing protein [Roseiconus nitratireducens]